MLMNADKVSDEAKRNKGGRPKRPTPDNPREPLADMRQERFCLEVAAGRSLPKAYANAGYSAVRADANSYRLMKTNEGVRNRIAALKEEAAIFFKTDRDNLVREHQKTAAQCFESRQGSARTAALREVSILTGIRPVNDCQVSVDVRHMSPQQLGSELNTATQRLLAKAMQMEPGPARDEHVTKYLAVLRVSEQMVTTGRIVPLPVLPMIDVTPDK
jgi:phage terminase small subunit